MSAAVDLVGQMAPQRVRLDRNVDRQKPCCNNIAVIRPGRGPHAAELRCESCGAHRGWLRAEALAFVESLTQRFGAPAEPLILREQTIGDYQMTDKQYDNSGILFRNDDKEPGNAKDRDYKGECTINGVEFWMSGWIKDGRKGKFMTFSFKAKDARKAATKSAAEDMDDSIPF